MTEPAGGGPSVAGGAAGSVGAAVAVFVGAAGGGAGMGAAVGASIIAAGEPGNPVSWERSCGSRV